MDPAIPVFSSTKYLPASEIKLHCTEHAIRVQYLKPSGWSSEHAGVGQRPWYQTVKVYLEPLYTKNEVFKVMEWFLL